MSAIARGARVLRSITRLAVKLVTHPRQGIRDVRAAFESVRMRLAGDSTFRRKSDLVHASSCPVKMIEKANTLWRPASVVDVGCGTGKALDYWLALGISDVVGLEGSAVAIEASLNPDRIQQADLSKPVRLGRRFDLVYCIEVAEHIHPNFADIFVDTLTSLGDRILMTAAHPDQGGLGHLNEQPKEYWIQKMAARGFRRELDKELEIQSLRDLYWENVMVFEGDRKL